MMLISVVLPTFNRYKVLGRAIDSVLAQTYSEWELIIVDNYSSDQTVNLVKSYHSSKISLYQIHNNDIIAKSRNFGIKQAQGKLIAFLDSDDWWTPRKLEISYDFLNAGADIVYHDLYFVKNEDQQYYWKKVKTIQVQEPVYEYLVKSGNVLTNSSVIVRKSLLEQIGGLSEKKEFLAWEDYDCWLRIAKHTERFVRINEPLGYYWAGGGNFSSTQQTLINLQAFHSFYLQQRYDDVPAWFHYSMGRIFFKLQRYDDAKPHLVKSSFSGLPSYKLKSVIIMLVIYFKLLLQRYSAKSLSKH
jgi:glycosyltransferase involved in cell wall biosynthesis